MRWLPQQCHVQLAQDKERLQDCSTEGSLYTVPGTKHTTLPKWQWERDFCNSLIWLTNSRKNKDALNQINLDFFYWRSSCLINTKYSTIKNSFPIKIRSNDHHCAYTVPNCPLMWFVRKCCLFKIVLLIRQGGKSQLRHC